MSNRYDIVVDVREAGVDNVLKKMKNLEAVGNRLRGKKFNLALGEIKGDVDKVLKRLGNMKLDIKRSKNDALYQIDKEIERLNRKKLDFPNAFKQAKKNLADLQAQANKKGVATATSQMAMAQMKRNFTREWGVNLDQSLKSAKKAFNERVARQKIDLNAEKRDVRYKASIDTSEVDKAAKRVRKEFEAVKITPHVDLKQVYTRWRDMQSRLGSQMQSIGNGLARLTNPIQSILRGTAYGIGYSALGKVTEGFGRSFARYDVMSTYPKMMKALGYSATDAEKAIHELDMSVRGLPTSLDDIVNAQKLFTLASGDMTKATKLAIAANNAFIGGGADETQRLFGMRQLQDLLSAGKLRSQEWYSLFKSMPVAIKAVGKELGYTGNKTKQFQSDLMSGKVTTDQFLNTLIKVGSEGGVVYQLAQNMKSTWSAVSANISIAFARMGENVLKSLDLIFEQATGKNLLQNVMGLKEYIDDISKSFNDWVKANPDKVMKFFDTIKSLDVTGFLKGFGEGLINVLDFFNSFIKSLPVGASTIAKFMIYGNMLGRFLGGAGGIVKGTSSMGAAIHTMVRFIRTTNAGAKIANLGAVQKLKNFFTRFKKVETAAAGAEATTGVGAAANATKGMAGQFKQLGLNFLRAIEPAALAVTYMGTVWASAKMLESISNTKVNWDRLTQNLAGVTIGLISMNTIMAGLSRLQEMMLGAGKEGAIRAGIGALASIVNAGVFTIVAKLMGEIQKVDIGEGWNIHGKIAKIGVAIFEMSGFLTLLGGLEAAFGGVGAILNVIGAIESVITAGSFMVVVKALDQIGRLKVPETSKIKDVGRAIEEMATNLLDQDMFTSLSRSLNAWDMKSTFEDLSEALGYIDGSIKSIGDIAKKMAAFGENYIDEAVIETATENMKTLKGGMTKIFDVVNEFFGVNHTKVAGQKMGGAQGADVPDYNESAFEDYNNMLTSVMNVIDNFTKISEKIGLIKTALAKVRKVYGVGEPFGDREQTIGTEQINADIKQIVGVIKAITDEGGLSELQSVSGKISGINLEVISAQLEKLPKVMDTLAKLRNALSGKKYDWLKPTGVQDVMADYNSRMMPTQMKVGEENAWGGQVKAILDTVKGMVQLLSQIGKELDKVQGIDEKANKLQTALNSVKKAISTLTRINTAVSGKNAQQMNTANLKTTISNAIRDLNSALANSDTLKTNAETFKTAITNIKNSLKSVTNGKGGSATAFVTALGKIPGALNKVSNAMNGKGAAWKKQLVNGFKGTAKAIKTELNSIATALGQLNFYNSGMLAGQTWAQGFIAGATGTNVTTPNTPQNVMQGIYDGISSLFGKTGGLITEKGVKYMSRGGSVGRAFPGSPKGVDRVPIWGQRGEYMMKKKAVDKFGVPFMQRINNLDIRGAMDRLYGRGGQLAFATPTITIDRSVHKIYNNNQQVHLTNNNASQGYQEGRASRFIRKL